MSDNAPMMLPQERAMFDFIEKHFPFLLRKNPFEITGWQEVYSGNISDIVATKEAMPGNTNTSQVGSFIIYEVPDNCILEDICILGTENITHSNDDNLEYGPGICYTNAIGQVVANYIARMPTSIDHTATPPNQYRMEQTVNMVMGLTSLIGDSMVLPLVKYKSEPLLVGITLNSSGGAADLSEFTGDIKIYVKISKLN